ncbi:hypothetical protein LX70_00554 [Defluviimonas denitrificans]|uniref:Uncharacterized protein n=1 Tax=Albidovulum denitrificans TaxID=404881 RepID=A0A2S8SD09_9RHOB|nr:terminase family protein [Defluviimonas denitrificans]PQV58741.1 hypothetical protein LX70_00554 [Defluviimonas denitrificans]
MDDDDQLALYLRTLEERLDPTALFRRVVGGPCDPWQQQMLTSTSPFVYACCSRRVGKSQTVGILAAHTVATPNRNVVILSPTLSQSTLLFKRCLQAWHELGLPIQKTRLTQTTMELDNGSVIVCVPAGNDGESARGLGVKDGGLLVYEEFSFISEDAITATLPIRETGGRILAITTPGRKGTFAHRLWEEENEIEKISARSVDIPRMAEKVAFDQRFMPPNQFATEHLLRWMGQGGIQFFAPETITAAFTDTPELKLGDFLHVA